MVKPIEMTLFSIVEEGQAIISERGIYKQVGLFERCDANGIRRLYAEVRGGFVRLLTGGNTTNPIVKWDAICGIEYKTDHMGPEPKTPAATALKAAE